MFYSITAFLSGNSPWIYLFIFFGKLIEVTLASLRSQLIHKGERTIGAVFALFEYSFWLCITASAISGFSNDILKIVVLIFAFAGGNVLGSILESKIALGFCTINCVFVARENALEAADLLRKNGYALTLFSAEGINGADRTAIAITIKRKHITAVKELLFSIDSNVVISILLAQQLEGGTVARIKK